jgi:hypothetical protein
VLHRYHHRFGGIGTVVTLDDGRAFTAAHCVAAVDGRPGVVIGSGDRRWRVVQRWSPARTDLALLRALEAVGAARATGPALRLVTRALLCPGATVEFVGHTGRRFQSRTATVVSVTATSAEAVVRHRRGVCANDSGGPVLMAGELVGIVTGRSGAARSSLCSTHVLFTRLDSRVMRARMTKARTRPR